MQWREVRESTGLSMREIGRRTGINSGRLSIIERGVEPSPAESEVLQRELLKAVAEKAMTDKVSR